MKLAELCIELIDLLAKSNTDTKHIGEHAHQTLSDDYIERMERIREKMVELNGGQDVG